MKTSKKPAKKPAKKPKKLQITVSDVEIISRVVEIDETCPNCGALLTNEAAIYTYRLSPVRLKSRLSKMLQDGGKHPPLGKNLDVDYDSYENLCEYETAATNHVCAACCRNLVPAVYVEEFQA